MERAKKKFMSEHVKTLMHPTIPVGQLDLVEPFGLGTGLVEASSSLWKRAAERGSVRFGDLVRWAFEEQKKTIDYPYNSTGERALRQKFQGIDGLKPIAQVYLNPLRSLVVSDRIEECTLLPLKGLLSVHHTLRFSRAWCPLCLASMRSGLGVYEPLLWRLASVNACPVHEVSLVTACHSCGGLNQYIFGRFARVGCCNRCGVWMGSRDATSAIRRSDGAELTVAREIMNLLARTAEIQSQGHDGRVTMSKFLAVDGMRDFLVSAYGLSSSGILSHVNQEYLPKLAVLVTIASVSKQPLHRVILGRVGNWKGCGVNSSQISIREKRVRKDWKAIEIQLGAIARGRDFVNFENSCKKLNVSMSSVRRRFPHLVAKIAARGLKLRRDNAISRKKEMLNRVKNAFRVLVSNGEYPSWRRLQDVTGVNIRNVNIKSLLDREWIRIEGVTDMRRRKRSSSPSTD